MRLPAQYPEFRTELTQEAKTMQKGVRGRVGNLEGLKRAGINSSTYGVMAFGAPTKYEPKFCAMVEEHCERGHSYESFAGKIGVTANTLPNWEKEHPDFLVSAGIAKERNRLWWEARLIESASGVITKETTEATDANGNKVITTVERGKVNNGSIQFALTNYFRKDYNNRSEVEVQGQIPVKIVAVEGYTGFGEAPTDATD